MSDLEQPVFKTIRTIPQQRTAMPEQCPAERVKNFGEVALGYGAEHAARESERCLIFLPRATCVPACPVGVDIPTFLARVSAGDLRGAYEVLAEANLLPAILRRVSWHYSAS